MIIKKELSELDIGFIAPNGDFYQSGYMQHIRIADTILNEMYGITKTTPDPVKILTQKGWISIHRQVFFGHNWMIGWDGHMTMEQVKVLKPLIDNNKDNIDEYTLLLLEQEFER